MNHHPKTVSILLIMILAGCDDRSARIAIQAADRQAEQNVEMARLNRSVADSTRALIGFDAKSQGQTTTLHHELLVAQSNLSAQRDQLEQERQRAARERRTESMLVPLVQCIGAPILVIVLLGFCWYALVGVSREATADSSLCELLIEEVVDGEPAHRLPRDTVGQRQSRSELPQLARSHPASEPSPAVDSCVRPQFARGSPVTQREINLAVADSTSES